MKKQTHTTVYGVGILGVKYPSKVNGDSTKEYVAWQGMLRRCLDVKYKEKHLTYKDVTCCDEWLNYENFYEWIHRQENFYKWLDNDGWSVDKDILIKNNKIYSPETCCLIPDRINKLFTKTDLNRGKYPIGVHFKKQSKRYCAQISQVDGQNNKKTMKHLGYYSTPDEAFQAYKQYKENYIKQVAQEEYEKGNIIKRCYEAMMNYEVEITD